MVRYSNSFNFEPYRKGIVNCDVHADCADYGNYASNCITQLDYVRDVLRKLLRNAQYLYKSLIHSIYF